MAQWGVVLGKPTPDLGPEWKWLYTVVGEWCVQKFNEDGSETLWLFNTRREAREWAKQATQRTAVRYHPKKYSE